MVLSYEPQTSHVERVIRIVRAVVMRQIFVLRDQDRLRCMFECCAIVFVVCGPYTYAIDGENAGLLRGGNFFCVRMALRAQFASWQSARVKLALEVVR